MGAYAWSVMRGVAKAAHQAARLSLSHKRLGCLCVLCGVCIVGYCGRIRRAIRGGGGTNAAEGGRECAARRRSPWL